MKVLLISHLPVATQNSLGRTFLSLFSGFDREELCQLYIYPAIPDVDRCSSFYRVTDKQVLRAFCVGRPGGEIPKDQIAAGAGLYENPKDETFYRDTKNKSAYRRLLRDAMWRLSRWDNDKLRDWLERENPGCIFVAPGAAGFLYDIALKISKIRKIPVISYICDEYYFVNAGKGLLEKWQRRRIKGKIRALIKVSSRVVTICDELRTAYASAFGEKTITVMTGAACAAAKAPRITDAPSEICYFGNIRCGRYRSLAQIAKELDRINAEFGADYRLKVYTSEKDPGILGTFADIRSLELCGFLTGEAFEKAFQQAQLLLHVEDFDGKNIDFVKHSISTKLADCLASGIPLLAYGPAQVASMGHLIRNECAIAATDASQLRQMLLTALQSESDREKVARKALKTAEQYHDSITAGKQIRECIEQVTAP